MSKTGQSRGNLSQKQIRFLKSMLEESSILKAAEKAEISRNTAYKYLEDREFVAELNKRRNECISDTVRFLQGKLALCGETLVKIIENPKTSEQVKINAINAIFTNCKFLTETADVLDRLQQVEETLNEEN